MVEYQLNERINFWLDRLQSNGYRLTGPRQAVVEILAKSQFVLDPTQVFLEARLKYPTIGLVTIYRTIEKLEELGLVLRVHQPSGCHSFIAAPAGHQHLMICSSCSRAEYFSGDNLSGLISQIGRDHGFSVQDHWLELFGLCNNCNNGAGGKKEMKC
jgi:Fur family transcriptional regulator, ferric uptake regulator